MLQYRSGISSIFVNKILLEQRENDYTIIFLLSMVTFVQLQSWVVITEIVWSEKPKILIILPFIENLCQSLF
jgi:hypothetical protein